MRNYHFNKMVIKQRGRFEMPKPKMVGATTEERLIMLIDDVLLMQNKIDEMFQMIINLNKKLIDTRRELIINKREHDVDNEKESQ